MISQALCTSFKAEVLLGVHDFRTVGGDTFKIALYTASAALGAGTAAYTTSGEASGTNYTAGGATLTNGGVMSSNNTGFATFDNITFSNVTLVARGALIYNTIPSALSASGAVLVNPAVCVLDFGADKIMNGQNLSIEFPADNSSSAIIRIG